MNRYLIFPCIGLTALFTGWFVWGPTPEYSGDASIQSTDVTGDRQDVSNLIGFDAERISDSLIATWHAGVSTGVDRETKCFSRAFIPDEVKRHGRLAFQPSVAFEKSQAMDGLLVGSFVLSREAEERKYPLIFNQAIGAASVFDNGRWSTFDDWVRSELAENDLAHR